MRSCEAKDEQRAKRRIVKRVDQGFLLGSTLTNSAIKLRLIKVTSHKPLPMRQNKNFQRMVPPKKALPFRNSCIKVSQKGFFNKKLCWVTVISYVKDLLKTGNHNKNCKPAKFQMRSNANENAEYLSRFTKFIYCTHHILI